MTTIDRNRLASVGLTLGSVLVLVAVADPVPADTDAALALVEDAAVVAATYGLLLATSGHVVRVALRYAGASDFEENVDTGRAVGKVENVLVLTLVALGAYTALAIVFTAKSIVRYQDMNSGNTTYYLTGTVANFTYSLLYGVAVGAVVSTPPF